MVLRARNSNVHPNSLSDTVLGNMAWTSGPMGSDPKSEGLQDLKVKVQFQLNVKALVKVH